MSDLAIRVEGLSKQYRLGRREPYFTLRDSIARRAGRWFGRKREESSSETVWALRDVSFEVRQGEVIGVIGRNGAGKSTLLKILSRVISPTSGWAELHGRMGSLLEVGTGFHSELTGRENVYLAGAILGMRRWEIKRKFDEIVAFAEVERFLDTPVKHYSTGMYMRLAFAVAAHLEPEILMVDEVLAVGDVAFQRKCMNKMGQHAEGGRTILFVSHNMAAVERLCPNALVLNAGQVTYFGSSANAIQQYLSCVEQQSALWHRRQPRPDHPHFSALAICNPDGSFCEEPTTASPIGIEVEFAIPKKIRELLLGVAIVNENRVPLFSTSPMDHGIQCPTDPGTYRTRVVFPKGLFMPKRFLAILSLYSSVEHYDTVDSALGFEVIEVKSLANLIPGGRIGELQLFCDWFPMRQAG
jgi:lipopolysaccharide transport system ATP-binding protein